MNELKVASSHSVFFWNMMGSLCNAASSVILLMAVTRISGAEVAGLFSIAFAIAQLLLTIGLFEVRPYQSTDIIDRFSFSQYYTFRVLTCIIMMFFAIIYVLIGQYDFYKSSVIILISFYKMFDALTDVFHGLFQQKNHLELAGKSLAFRVIISTIVFCLGLYLLKNLIIATIAAIIISIIWYILYDLQVVKYFSKRTFVFDWVRLFKIATECFPLFAGSFMMMYILNSPKYAIDIYLPIEMQTYYNIIFMPASVVNLFSLFIFRPMLTTMAEDWNQKNYKAFKKLVIKLLGCIIVLTICVLIVAYFAGIPVLSYLYGVNLHAYHLELLIVLLGGGVSAMTTFLYYAITVMRKQYYLLIGYGLSFIVAIILSIKLVKMLGILGGALSYVIVMNILLFSFLVIFVINYRNNCSIIE
ncbi:MAG: lipopolysaccharide biosynthesis protein [Malacoplasma sp.]